MRRGGAKGSVGFLADGTFRINISWGDPHGGTGHDTFVLQDINTLRVESFILVDGRTASYNVMYRRKV